MQLWLAEMLDAFAEELWPAMLPVSLLKTMDVPLKQRKASIRYRGIMICIYSQYLGKNNRRVGDIFRVSRTSVFATLKMPYTREPLKKFTNAFESAVLKAWKNREI